MAVMKVRCTTFKPWYADWVAKCDACGETTTCENWSDAMEAACGHITWQHPRIKVNHSQYVTLISRVGTTTW